MNLSGKQRHYLRGLAHHKKPVVLIGDAGVSAAVLHEIEQALNHHELVKIKLRADREEREQMLARICEQTGAEPVQMIGQMAVIFRPADPPRISLP
jgi:RNA-binding protein